MKYRLLDHTADLAVEVTAPNPETLYADTGLVLFNLISESKHFKQKKELHLDVKGQDREDLMVNWLRELLYLWTGKEMLVVAVQVINLSETRLSARVMVDLFSPDRHVILNEIKAVTYHRISVEKGRKGWAAVVVFDI